MELETKISEIKIITLEQKSNAYVSLNKNFIDAKKEYEELEKIQTAFNNAKNVLFH